MSKNHFDQATGCVAVYNCESGALGTDSKGDNDLTVTGVAADTIHYKQGAASGDFEQSEGDEMTLADASLSSGFPLKYGTSNLSFTWTCWIRPESSSASYYYYFLGKQGTNTTYSTGLFVFGSTPKVYFFLHRADGDPGQCSCSDAMTLGQWYFIAATYDNVGHMQRIRVWDDTAGVWLSGGSNVSTSPPSLSESAFAVGAPSATGFLQRRFDGNIDEVTVWSQVLSFTDIELIKDGMYPGLAGSVGAVSSVTGHFGETHLLAGHVGALSSVVVRGLQMRRRVFVPAQALAAPYPVPRLHDFARGENFHAGFEQWSLAYSKWWEEHMIRVMREVARLGQEKASRWQDA